MEAVDFTKLIEKAAIEEEASTLYVKKDFEIKNVDPDLRRIAAIASVEEIDRHGEIVAASAFKAALAGYMRNPVILACHRHYLTEGRSPVVGHCVSAEVIGKNLEIIVQFADTDLGEEYWKLYRAKHQRAFSVGFIAKKTEMKKIGRKEVTYITELELLEISCVPIPANRSALSKSALGKQSFVNQKRNFKNSLSETDFYNDFEDEFDTKQEESGGYYYDFVGDYYDIGFFQNDENPSLEKTYTHTEVEAMLKWLFNNKWIIDKLNKENSNKSQNVHNESYSANNENYCDLLTPSKYCGF